MIRFEYFHDGLMQRHGVSDVPFEDAVPIVAVLVVEYGYDNFGPVDSAYVVDTDTGAAQFIVKE